MVDPGIKNSVLLMFRAKDFEGMWFTLKSMYSDLGFTDDITDQQRIDEYKWIVQQLRKYMFSKQDEILACDNLTEMVAKVDDLIGKADEYGDERKKVVYNFLRDHWLYELRNHLSNMIMDIMPDYDEEEEE